MSASKRYRRSTMPSPPATASVFERPVRAEEAWCCASHSSFTDKGRRANLERTQRNVTTTGGVDGGR